MRSRHNWHSVVLFMAIAAAAGPAAAAAQPAGTPVSIDERARVSVGVTAGDTLYELDAVASPFLLPDGRLVVPLRNANSIRVYGPDGRFLTAHGRSGEGPGEFRSLLTAWPRGDTIEALDWRLRRIVRFLPDGSSDEITIDTNLPDLSAAAGVFGEGWAVGGVAAGGFGRRDSVVMRRIMRDGSDGGPIAHAPGYARFGAAGGGGGPEPLSPRAAVAVTGGRVFIGETLTPAIRIAGVDQPEREVRWTAGPAADPRRAHRQVIEAALERAQPGNEAALRRRYESAPDPTSISVFWTFVADELGFIWIRPYDPARHAFTPFPGGSEGGRWTIVSPAGRVVGEIDVPPDLEPHQITRDAVVGIARDELGVESVRVHALHRR